MVTAGPFRRDVLRGLSGLAVAGAAASAAPASAAEVPPSTVTQIYTPRDFGARGDGEADDTSAFRAMHRTLRQRQAEDDRFRAADPQRPPVEFVIRLDPGRYRYTWNRWTWGLRRVTVLGYGATIQCLHSGPYDIDQAPLMSNRDHYWAWAADGPAYGDTSAGPAEQYGLRLRTARPGDEAVTLLAPAAPLPFASGNWVLIQSYAQQQYGYPPNMRYFERARVTAVDGLVIRLDRPLRHLHRDDWPEDPSQPPAIGSARIVAIDRPDCPLALSQRFLGLTVASNPRHAVRDAGIRTTRETLNINGTMQAVVEDCDLIAFGVSQVGDVQVRNCSFAYTEPDKLIDRLSFEGCTIGSLQQCTGVNHLTLRNCTIEGDAQILAREAVVDGCTFPGPASPGEDRRGINLEGPNPTRRMTVTGCRFFGRGDPTGHALRGPVWIEAAIDGRDVRLRDGNRLHVAYGSQAYSTLVDLLEEGWPIRIEGPDGPQFGRCSEIADAGDGAVIGVSVPGRLRPGARLSIPRLLSLSVTGCRSTGLPGTRPDPPDLTWEDEIDHSRRLRMVLRSTVASRPAWLPGYLTAFRCIVLRPYTGPSPGCFLTLREEGPEPFELNIDLTQAGTREVTGTGLRLNPNDGFTIGGRPARQLPDLRYVRAAWALIVTEPGAVPAPALGSEAEQAVLRLEVEVEPPFA
ncbi:hypothetical protein [Inquilinus sp. Marseille-Q2685]|uniref:hypothetical protein n=1 Tax=Inquilinus sp. Marseille-Q2685 TaxID=2866581 RepID=UPI001CE3CFE4|nr:hypothetical protein [Inquilinus sp. Marseille-Q2685]